MEFTKEFIEEQQKLLDNVSPRPWHACTCGKCGMISGDEDLIATATHGDWGDDYPDMRRVGGSIEGKVETFMNQITYGHIPEETGKANAKYIEQACNNYPDALNEISRLLAEQTWIPVTTELPISSDRVLVRMSNYHTVIASYFVIPKYWKNDAGAKVFNVTHWQHLPQPPKGER